MFAHRASRSLPHYSYFIYSISGRSDSPDTATTRPYDLVGPAAADSSSLRFESSTSAGWVDVFDRLPGVIGRWFRWARYIRPCVLVPFVLTLCLQLVATFRLVSSSRATPRAAARARVPPYCTRCQSAFRLFVTCSLRLLVFFLGGSDGPVSRYYARVHCNVLAIVATHAIFFSVF